MKKTIHIEKEVEAKSRKKKYLNQSLDGKYFCHENVILEKKSSDNKAKNDIMKSNRRNLVISRSKPNQNGM